MRACTKFRGGECKKLKWARLREAHRLVSESRQNES